MLTYESSGNINVAGCASADFKRNYLTRFSVGLKVYIKRQASVGRLEYVVIKKINKQFPNNKEKYGLYPIIMYVDTYNRIWAEEELVLQAEALILASNYLEKMDRLNRDLFKNCLPINPDPCVN